jgi:hypothetical protein
MHSIYDLEFPSMVLFKRRPVDRTCLLSQKNTNVFYLDDPEEVAFYQGELDSVQQIVQFINKECDLHRLESGGLNNFGRKKKELLQNLYSVKKEIENQPLADGEEFKCERIETPTMEEFFVNYVTKSKPVIITGGTCGVWH